MNCQWPKCGCAEREQCKPEKPSVAEIDLTQFDGHTPSWKAGQRRDGSWWLSTGEVSSGPHAQFDIHVLRDQDARLIAAAPDLLAAYQAALARAEQFRKEYEHELAEGRIYGAISNEMTRQRDAALARAEAAEKARDRYATKYGSAFKALTEAERQRDEAFTAGAEAMREACVVTAEVQCKDPKNSEGRYWCGEVAAALRVLPFPAKVK